MGDFMGGEGLGWRGEREGWMKNRNVPFCWWFE